MSEPSFHHIDLGYKSPGRFRHIMIGPSDEGRVIIISTCERPADMSHVKAVFISFEHDKCTVDFVHQSSTLARTQYAKIRVVATAGRDRASFLFDFGRDSRPLAQGLTILRHIVHPQGFFYRLIQDNVGPELWQPYAQAILRTFHREARSGEYPISYMRALRKAFPDALPEFMPPASRTTASSRSERSSGTRPS
jgi:hypothetical protein